jgi:hypothetical protein
VAQPTTPQPWPCMCGAPGVRNIGTDGYCAAHLGDLYATFTPAVFKMNGVGVQDGHQRPEWGPNYYDVRCVACGATWAGLVGEPCAWCALSLQQMTEWQSETVVQPPEVDIDDERWPNALEAWAKRMRVAVTAGIITERTAVAALSREAGRRAA